LKIITKIIVVKKENLMKNILIIEDEKSVRENIVDILEISGYTVFIANNGKQGLLMSKTTTPDLIITDIAMPVLNGLEMIRQIKDDFRLKNIPILVITAQNKIENEIINKQSGNISLLMKPFNVNTLKMKVDEILKLRKN